MRCICAALVLVLVSPPAPARIAQEKYQFQKANPCPVNGAHRGRCPGHDIDHITPLCAGGADHRSNMQWLTKAEHRAKTRVDVRHCRALKRKANSGRERVDD